jgi:hypothetical protein
MKLEHPEVPNKISSTEQRVFILQWGLKKVCARAPVTVRLLTAYRTLLKYFIQKLLFHTYAYTPQF